MPAQVRPAAKDRGRYPRWPCRVHASQGPAAAPPLAAWPCKGRGLPPQTLQCPATACAPPLAQPLPPPLAARPLQRP
eukprot:5850779-Prymnesium_polylepis.1